MLGIALTEPNGKKLEQESGSGRKRKGGSLHSLGICASVFELRIPEGRQKVVMSKTIHG